MKCRQRIQPMLIDFDRVAHGMTVLCNGDAAAERARKRIKETSIHAEQQQQQTARSVFDRVPNVKYPECQFAPASVAQSLCAVCHRARDVDDASRQQCALFDLVMLSADGLLDRITVNADDTTLFGTSINQELTRLALGQNLGLSTVRLLLENSFRASFATPRQKQEWLRELDRAFARLCGAFKCPMSAANDHA